MAKLEYFIHKLPKGLVKGFGEHLANSPRQKDLVLGQLMELVLLGITDKAVLYDKLYPGKPLHEKQIRNLRSDLLQRLLDFLVEEELRLSPDREVLLAKALNRYGITEHFPALAQKMEDQLSKMGKGIFTAESWAALTYEIEQNKFQEDGRKGIDFPRIIAGYEEAFVLRVLYLAMSWQSHRAIVGDSSTYESVLLPVVLEQIKAGRFVDFPLVELHYHVFLTMQNTSHDASFFEARRLIRTQVSVMEAGSLKELYQALIYYSIQKTNQGHVDFTLEVYTLYLEMLDCGLIGTHDMNPFHFKNIVTSGLKLGKFSEVSAFIGMYGILLNDKYREHCLRYAHGLLHYYQQEYQQAERLLNHVLNDFEDPFLGIDARSYLMQIYYETKDDIGMESMPDAFRKFLKRHKKISRARLKFYEEFIRFYQRLVRLKPGNDAQLEKLRSDVLDNPYSAARSWLLGKIGEEAGGSR